MMWPDLLSRRMNQFRNRMAPFVVMECCKGNNLVGSWFVEGVFNCWQGNSPHEGVKESVCWSSHRFFARPAILVIVASGPRHQPQIMLWFNLSQ